MMAPRSKSFLTATTLLSVLSGAAILNLASPANALTLRQTQTYRSSSQGASGIFQKFDSALGTLKNVYFSFEGGASTGFRCSSVSFCVVQSTMGGGLGFGSASISLPMQSTARSAGPNETSSIAIGTGASGKFINVSDFIGTGTIGGYGLGVSTSPYFVSGAGFPSFIDQSSTYNVRASLDYEYEVPDPIPPATAVPTPALLPGLIGMGVAALRKKGRQEPVEQEA